MKVEQVHTWQDVHGIESATVIIEDGQKPEPDFLCACNGKACDGICRAKSGHFRHAGSVGLEAKDGGCTAAYRPPKPKAARRPRR